MAIKITKELTEYSGMTIPADSYHLFDLKVSYDCDYSIHFRSWIDNDAKNNQKGNVGVSELDPPAIHGSFTEEEMIIVGPALALIQGKITADIDSKIGAGFTEVV